MRRRLVAGLVALAALLMSAGCGQPTISDLPLPGNEVSGETVRLRLTFDNALNLAVGAPVKVDGVDMGKVLEVSVENFQAKVRVLVRDDARIRRGATARLRYNTPLGELFVDIDNPEQGPVLEDGATIGLEHTSTAPTVEDTLAAASLLINGGGLAQLQTITEELLAMLNGRERTITQLLDRTNRFLSQVSATTDAFDRVLSALADVSSMLHQRRSTINAALQDLGPTARVLHRRTDKLTRLLTEVEQFAATANETVQKTRDQILRMVQKVEPVLSELLSNRGRFGVSLTQLVRAGNAATEVIPGDWISIRLDANIGHITLPDPTGDPKDPGGDGGLLGEGGLLGDGGLLGGDGLLGEGLLGGDRGKQGPDGGGGGRQNGGSDGGSRGDGGPGELLDDLGLSPQASPASLSGLIGGAR